MPADPDAPIDPSDPSDPRPVLVVDDPAPARPAARAVPLIERFHAHRHDPRVVAGALGLIALLAAFAWVRLGAPHGSPGEDADAWARADRAAARARAAEPAPVIVAQVAGAVTNPGLVRLRDGDRVADAIAAAGGARSDADLDAVTLAARVADGERILVPVRGAGPPTGAGGPDAGPARAAGGPVHLNAATAEELETLPGIGPSLAAAILRERQARGGFRSVDDLDAVRGIGAARLAELEPLVAL